MLLTNVYPFYMLSWVLGTWRTLEQSWSINESFRIIVTACAYGQISEIKKEVDWLNEE